MPFTDKNGFKIRHRWAILCNKGQNSYAHFWLFNLQSRYTFAKIKLMREFAYSLCFMARTKGHTPLYSYEPIADEDFLKQDEKEQGKPKVVANDGKWTPRTEIR